MTLRIHPEEIVRASKDPRLAVHPSWRRVPLGEVADVLNGFAFKSSYFSDSGGMPLLRIRDVGRTSTQKRYVGDYDPIYLVKNGDMVIGMDGDFRVARWGGGTAVLNQRVCKVSVRDTNLYDPAFLRYVLPGYLDAIHAQTSSVTVKHLSSKTVQQIPLPLPPIAEQRRIVVALEGLFSNVDAAEGSFARAQQTLFSLRRSVVSQAVSEDWPVRRLGDVTESQIYGTSAKASRDSSGVPVLRMGNLRDGVIDFTDLKYLPHDHRDVGKCRLMPGDVLFNRTNSPELVGKSAVFVSGPEPTAFASYLIRIRLGKDCDPNWAALVINSALGRRYVAGVRTQQVGQANVNGTKLAAMPIPLPPINVQRRILERLDKRTTHIRALAGVVDKSQRRSALLRRAILDLAFRGRLVARDPSDEPVYALADRIAATNGGEAQGSGRRTKVPA